MKKTARKYSQPCTVCPRVVRAGMKNCDFRFRPISCKKDKAFCFFLLPFLRRIYPFAFVVGFLVSQGQRIGPDLWPQRHTAPKRRKKKESRMQHFNDRSNSNYRQLIPDTQRQRASCGVMCFVVQHARFHSRKNKSTASRSFFQTKVKRKVALTFGFKLGLNQRRPSAKTTVKKQLKKLLWF